MLNNISPTQIIGILSGFFGLILVYSHWRVFVLEYRTREWRVVEGVIVRSELGIFESNYGYRGGWFYPDIEYEYEVHGMPYTGKTIDLVHLAHLGAPQYTDLAGTARFVVDKYPLNTYVEVFYDPHQPSRALLKRTASWGIRVNLLLGMILLFIAPFLSFVSS